MIGLLGKKLGMTQIFDEEGRQIPVTVLEIGPCHITALRTKEKDGYSAVQIGYGEAKEKHLNRPMIQYFRKSKLPNLKHLKEIRTDELEKLEVGQKLDVSNFEVGDFVDVEGISIGKGFQGVVKRHGFKGSKSKSHGSMHGREPGSIGQSAFPSRVMKGMKGAGRMGNEQVTTQNLKVVQVDQEKNLLTVKGSVPGSGGNVLLVRSALKKGPDKKWKIPSPPEESSKEAEKASDGSDQKTEPQTESSEEKNS